MPHSNVMVGSVFVVHLFLHNQTMPMHNVPMLRMMIVLLVKHVVMMGLVYQHQHNVSMKQIHSMHVQHHVHSVVLMVSVPSPPHVVLSFHHHRMTFAPTTSPSVVLMVHVKNYQSIVPSSNHVMFVIIWMGIQMVVVVVEMSHNVVMMVHALILKPDNVEIYNQPYNPHVVVPIQHVNIDALMDYVLLMPVNVVMIHQ